MANDNDVHMESASAPGPKKLEWIFATPESIVDYHNPEKRKAVHFYTSDQLTKRNGGKPYSENKLDGGSLLLLAGDQLVTKAEYKRTLDIRRLLPGESRVQSDLELKFLGEDGRKARRNQLFSADMAASGLSTKVIYKQFTNPDAMIFKSGGYWGISPASHASNLKTLHDLETHYGKGNAYLRDSDGNYGNPDHINERYKDPNSANFQYYTAVKSTEINNRPDVVISVGTVAPDFMTYDDLYELHGDLIKNPARYADRDDVPDPETWAAYVKSEHGDSYVTGATAKWLASDQTDKTGKVIREANKYYADAIKDLPAVLTDRKDQWGDYINPRQVVEGLKDPVVKGFGITAENEIVSLKDAKDRSLAPHEIMVRRTSESGAYLYSFDSLQNRMEGYHNPANRKERDKYDISQAQKTALGLPPVKGLPPPEGYEPVVDRVPSRRQSNASEFEIPLAGLKIAEDPRRADLKRARSRSPEPMSR